MQVAAAATLGTYSSPFGRYWNLVTYNSSSCMCKFIIYQFELHSRTSILSTTLLTPWCRVLLEQLTGLQLVKKFPAFHGTRRFITAFTSLATTECDINTKVGVSRLKSE